MTVPSQENTTVCVTTTLKTDALSTGRRSVAIGERVGMGRGGFEGKRGERNEVLQALALVVGAFWFLFAFLYRRASRRKKNRRN